MSRPELPIEALPAWSLLNDVSFVDVKVADVDGKGFGLVVQRNLTTVDDTFDIPTLLSVPHGLILNAEAVEQYAKEDRNFKQLLDAVGRQSPRKDILLFLLVQLSLASRSSPSSTGLSNPWTEYIKFLPRQMLLPTLWREGERMLLRGTSLESAVNAKLSALNHEFDRIREKSSDIPTWNAALWENNAVGPLDWILVDAWYRSRCLELPKSGESMVPCLDMANHSAGPTAYYEENSKDEVVLLLRPGVSVTSGDEISISYGESKSAAEMLFSYGFIDEGSAIEELVLPMEPLPGDPLAKAKAFIFSDPPTVQICRKEGQVEWTSPFVYLMCLNEEDGLEFRVLQDKEGNQQLRLFWQEADVTGLAKEFETLVRDHPFQAVFKLRVVTVIQERLLAHLDRMLSAMSLDQPSSTEFSALRAECLRGASLLRDIETRLLESAVEYMEREKSQLYLDKNVVAYLGSMEISQSELADDDAANQEDDFS